MVYNELSLAFILHLDILNLYKTNLNLMTLEFQKDSNIVFALAV